jgi:hypothetical protein
MATKRVSICKVLVQLNSPAKELQSSLMFLLQTIAVTYHAPCFGGKERLLKCKVAQVGQLMLLF